MGLSGALAKATLYAAYAAFHLHCWRQLFLDLF